MKLKEDNKKRRSFDSRLEIPIWMKRPTVDKKISGEFEGLQSKVASNPLLTKPTLPAVEEDK